MFILSWFIKVNFMSLYVNCFVTLIADRCYKRLLMHLLFRHSSTMSLCLSLALHAITHSRTRFLAWTPSRKKYIRWLVVLNTQAIKDCGNCNNSLFSCYTPVSRIGYVVFGTKNVRRKKNVVFIYLLYIG